MGQNNRWLHQEILKIAKLRVGGYDPVIAVSIGEEEIAIYAPGPDEYLVTVAVLQKAISLGATHVSFASAWAFASAEAKQFADENGIWLAPHGATLAHVKEKARKV